MQPVWAAGLMTGTVLDGNIDVALLKTDGEFIEQAGAFRLVPYPQAIRDRLEEALGEARRWNFNGPEPEIFAQVEASLTRAQAEAVRILVKEAGLTLAEIGVVGFHGQTVLHRPPVTGGRGATRQLGDGALMARLLGVRVAFDFRSADIGAGGQGAPLAACYHAALLRGLSRTGDAAVLNLGGVANLTWAGGQGTDGQGTDGPGSDGQDGLVAFDTGPANAPINDFVKRHGFGEMDRDGALARKGRVDEARLARLLEHAYFRAPYPKSLDRFDFTADMAEGLDIFDGAATLTAFSAAAVGKGLDLLPRRPARLIVSGGGRHNPVLMAMLKERAGAEPVPAERLGWRGDALEAECFAFLAVRTLRGLPISFPSTTGVPAPMPGGRLASP